MFNMRKVGLIFGSFNPIHNAHIRIGELAIDSGLVDEVWFVLAKQNPFKDNYEVDFDDRDRMIFRCRFFFLNTQTQRIFQMRIAWCPPDGWIMSEKYRPA